MNCQEFELKVRDLARHEVDGRNVEQLLGANEHAQAVTRAVAHVDTCEVCASRLQDEQALGRRLDALATEMTSFAPPARIEVALLQAFRLTVAQSIPGSAGILPAASIERKGGQDARAPRTVGGAAYWLTAAAAVLLLVFGIALVRAKLSQTSQPNIHQAAEAKAPAPDSTPVSGEKLSRKGSAESIPTNVSTAKDNHEPAIHQVRSKARRQLRQQPANQDAVASLSTSAATPQTTAEQSEPEVTTQFIALSYVAPASLQDGGQLVRIELPRSAMASFGLPVNMDRLGERVKADVFVSADGFARAIRFVQ